MSVHPAEELYILKSELLAQRCTLVSPHAFYRDVFPEGSLEQRGNFEDRRPNAIFTIVPPQSVGEERRFAHNTIMFDDLQELNEVLGAEFAVASPLSYRGRNRTAVNAHHLWGFAIDLDGVGLSQLGDLIHQIDNGLLPPPTYLVNSGNGIHVYYLFEDPVPLFTWMHGPLGDLKHGLTDIVWNAYTSTIPAEQKQFQGIFQGYRMPGAQSKLGPEYPVTAYKFGPKCMITSINDYVADQYRLKNYDEMNRLTLEEAKEKYPQWYQARIVEGKKRGHWIAKRDLYDWWIRQIRLGAFEGNRYHCIATLMTYGIKCGVSKDEVLTDALELQPLLNRLTKTSDNEFTVQDVYDAFAFFDDDYATYSIKAIQARTKIQFKRNKRNFRKQKQHLKIMSAVRDVLHPEGEWRNKDGRPKGSGTAEQKVAEYRAEHPEDSVTEVARALGISRPTVYKWWNSEKVTDRQLSYTPGGVVSSKVRPIGPEIHQKNEELLRKYLKPRKD